ncbi:MAG: IPExxxVDY family protein [Bacteroidota bacterium]
MARLNVPYDFSFELITILSSKKPHKLAWEINKIFGVNLCRVDDFFLSLNTNVKSGFINFMFKTEYITIRLIKNKAKPNRNPKINYLLPELSQYDFFLLVEDFTDQISSEYLIESLRKIQGVEHLLQINPTELKNKENLLF